MATTRWVEPVRPVLARPSTMQLAATEYDRVVELFRALNPDDWSARTDCPDWDVRAMAAHMLGMVEMAASLRDQLRQMRAAGKRGGMFIDALTAVQVDERHGMSPQQILERFTVRAPKAVAGRRRTPGFVRRRRMPVPQHVNGRDEAWTLGFLIDVILTRDPWMHRIDITRATGAGHVVTPEHDGVIVADVVAEWAARHGRPYDLRLTGAIGGHWSAGAGGEHLEMDTIDFCRALSGRTSADGVFGVQVPF